MRILVVGATGLLGSHIVRLLATEHDVVGASRKGSELHVDLSDKRSIEAMYAQAGSFDAIICAAGSAKFAPLAALGDEDFSFSLANKLMGQVNLVRCGVDHVSQGGSFTLTSGVLAQQPMEGSAAVSIVNAGVEAFARSAALELRGKARVNVVSPGWVAETLESMGRDPSQGVPAEIVAQAYKRTLGGSASGEVVSAS
ncbi:MULTISPECIES: short chain dehydrogenase [Paraburkholderia]|uniref:NADP-dependent 3-hydroxy acid dehydrogenase YdfG n=1 Tax=Paraburkholderia tuberum TaxID=157910 RepID=A0A1H1JEZ5_9BURK|nr:MULTISPECIES: short chain dehydrogenase [Paraburkholderia]MBB5411399.1 NAD(P)-dependent dehydrogenase (short-subunit alcohol dehydrogenase family) [Paraburkholderia sp. HC6.4b]MBB5449934.1 NAD(P)-dependent dehydrogenase (short-subunit alcohol dehydrogenase family) [Paraburkholderia sp. Kb1A]SDR48473.1 NADP-dependent 3-hydroxy acid dehydrogenase YdfG [Paraburkholderia tuberum]